MAAHRQDRRRSHWSSAPTTCSRSPTHSVWTALSPWGTPWVVPFRAHVASTTRPDRRSRVAATSRDFRGRARDRIGFQAIPVLLAAAGCRTPEPCATWSAPFSPDCRPNCAAGRRPSSCSDPRSVLEAAAALGRFTSRSWLQEVDVPSSVIVAINDHVVPVQRQLELARAIDGSVAAFVDGDHHAVGSAPEDFLPVLVHECLAISRRSPRAGTRELSYWHLDA